MKLLLPLVVTAVAPLFALAQEKLSPPQAPEIIVPAPIQTMPGMHEALSTPMQQVLPAPRSSIWVLYANDSRGYQRPRVVYSPGSSHYLYNGTPYPFSPVKPRTYGGSILQ